MLNESKERLWWKAPHSFEAFLQYVEWDRKPEDRFYNLQREKRLKLCIEALQMLADDKLDFLAILLQPFSGKTALAKFYLTWIAGRNPGLACLGFTHSSIVADDMYQDCVEIIESKSDYLWSDIFPNTPLIDTSKKNTSIDLGVKKRFKTLEFSDIFASNIGTLCANNLVYFDDLVGTPYDVMGEARREKLWQRYLYIVRETKAKNTKELHIATQWDKDDVIGRLKKRHKDNDRALFIEIM